MPKYRVTLIIDATSYIDVEAANADEAKEMALDNADQPRLCHQCSNAIELGDIIDTGDVSEL